MTLHLTCCRIEILLAKVEVVMPIISAPFLLRLVSPTRWVHEPVLIFSTKRQFLNYTHLFGGTGLGGCRASFFLRGCQVSFSLRGYRPRFLPRLPSLSRLACRCTTHGAHLDCHP
jgi:hypothetical protein